MQWYAFDTLCTGHASYGWDYSINPKRFTDVAFSNAASQDCIRIEPSKILSYCLNIHYLDLVPYPVNQCRLPVHSPRPFNQSQSHPYPKSYTHQASFPPPLCFLYPPRMHEKFKNPRALARINLSHANQTLRIRNEGKATKRKHTLHTSLTALLFSPPPLFMASRISPSFITR